MRNRGVRRLTVVLSATELCELVPDIPIMTDFRITPLKWINPANVAEHQRTHPAILELTRPSESTNGAASSPPSPKQPGGRGCLQPGWRSHKRLFPER